MKPLGKQVVPVFLIALVLGAALGCWGQRAAMRHFRRTGHDSARMLEKMSRDLSLDPQQKEAVKALLDADSVKLKALRAETRAKFDSLRQTMHADIKKALNAEQQAKFDAIVAEHEERRKKRREMIQK